MEDHNSPEAVAKRASQEDPIVMYLIVRESLGMSIGKTAAQCAHASQMLQLLMNKEEFEFSLLQPYCNADGPMVAPTPEQSKRWDQFQNWLNSSFRKVVLRADDKEWAKIRLEIPTHNMVVVVDAGLTEIPAGSETVIGLWPMLKSERPAIIKKLQVLK